ncbi:MAG: PEP-CTERM sorting domain-containing protein [Candidatus Acidiferrales bacterium]
MRKAILILGIFSLAIAFAATEAMADNASFDVSGTYSTVSGNSSTSTPISNPGDAFSFTFTVDPTTLQGVTASSPLSINTPDNVAITYNDTTAGITDNVTGMITLESSVQGGLLDIDFMLGSDPYTLLLSSPTNQQLYNITTVSGVSTATIDIGNFQIEDDAGNCFVSFLGQDDTACTSVGSGSVVTASVAPTPEPSTVLLLGSGIVGLLAFGRRKLFA